MNEGTVAMALLQSDPNVAFAIERDEGQSAITGHRASRLPLSFALHQGYYQTATCFLKS